MVVMVAILAVVVACRVGKVQVGIDQDGDTVTMSPGNQLLVSLPGNPSTGFRWSVVEIPDELLARVGDVEFQSKSNPTLLGSGGVEVLSFDVLRRGKGTLRLKYSRPWEHDIPASKEVVFHLESR